MREVELRQEQAGKLERILALTARGLKVVDASRIDVRGELSFGSNVKVEVNVIFKGAVSLGDNVSVGANCIIEDSVIDADVTIMDFSTVSSARIGAGSRVGPYARLRPGSRIGPSCQIGNFVEIKEATMGAGCKINHHSFIGNALLGEEVVIGAGSITCNHDGRGIQETFIADRAYIGSGTLLIAPVRIGASAVVGAGSTITEDVPANMLAICRTQAMVLKHRKHEKGGTKGDES